MDASTLLSCILNTILFSAIGFASSENKCSHERITGTCEKKTDASPVPVFDCARLTRFRSCF